MIFPEHSSQLLSQDFVALFSEANQRTRQADLDSLLRQASLELSAVEDPDSESEVTCLMEHEENLRLITQEVYVYLERLENVQQRIDQNSYWTLVLDFKPSVGFDSPLIIHLREDLEELNHRYDVAISEYQDIRKNSGRLTECIKFDIFPVVRGVFSNLQAEARAKIMEYEEKITAQLVAEFLEDDEFHEEIMEKVPDTVHNFLLEQSQPLSTQDFRERYQSHGWFEHLAGRIQRQLFLYVEEIKKVESDLALAAQSSLSWVIKEKVRFLSYQILGKCLARFFISPVMAERDVYLPVAPPTFKQETGVRYPLMKNPEESNYWQKNKERIVEDIEDLQHLIAGMTNEKLITACEINDWRFLQNQSSNIAVQFIATRLLQYHEKLALIRFSNPEISQLYATYFGELGSIYISAQYRKSQLGLIR